MRRVLILISTIAFVATACASASDDAGSQAPDPTTTTAAPAASTTLAAPPSGDQDAAEITTVYEVVFSSETTYEEKAALIDDPSGLEETIAKYNTTGESMGGIGLVATNITVSGDEADVTYDLLFGGNPTYPDLTGDAIRVDGAWIVTRDMFCSIMTSARVGCPSS